MGKTIRHKNDKYFHLGELVEKQYVPQNHASKEYAKRDINVPNIGGRAYNGHKPSPRIHSIYSGILRAKIKEETREDINLNGTEY